MMYDMEAFENQCQEQSVILKRATSALSVCGDGRAENKVDFHGSKSE